MNDAEMSRRVGKPSKGLLFCVVEGRLWHRSPDGDWVPYEVDNDPEGELE